MNDEVSIKNSEAHFKVDGKVAFEFREAVRHRYKEKSHGMMQIEIEKALRYYKKNVLDDYFESGIEPKKVNDGLRNRASIISSPTADR